MRVWIKKHIGLSIGTGILLILLLMCSGIVFVWSNYSKINRTLWEWNEPERYYIKIRYSHEGICSRTWESVWEDNKLINTISNGVSRNEYCTEEDLHIAEWSMDYVFDEVVGNCGKEPGAVLCGVEYDSHFHYPSRITSYYTSSFVVEDFVACGKDKPSCP